MNNTDKKYELLTNDTIEVDGNLLYRIRALRDFGNVKKGDLGGYIQSESNLSHEGSCWVYNDAQVYGNARVCEDARVYDNAQVYGYAIITGYAHIYRYAKVYDYATIQGEAVVGDHARVLDNSSVFQEASVLGRATVNNRARVYGKAYVDNDAQIYGDAILRGTSKVLDISRVYEDAVIQGNAVLSNAVIGKYGYVSSNKDYKVSERRLDGYHVTLYNTREPEGVYMSHDDFINSVDLYKQVLIDTCCTPDRVEYMNERLTYIDNLKETM